MIERRNRDIGAAVLRDLIDGRITNEDFARRFPSSSDSGLRAVRYFAWGQFSDLRIHTLTGRDRPQPERITVLERCYLFLKTDFEFEWPMSEPSIGRGLLQILTLGRLFRISDEEYKSKGDFEVWPFIRKSDYETLIK
jgi:hypothetical protein